MKKIIITLYLIGLLCFSSSNLYAQSITITMEDNNYTDEKYDYNEEDNIDENIINNNEGIKSEENTNDFEAISQVDVSDEICTFYEVGDPSNPNISFTEPEVTEPEVTEPEVTEPEVTEPEVTEPEVTEPEVTEPEVTEPEVTDPEEQNEITNTGLNYNMLLIMISCLFICILLMVKKIITK